VMVGEEEEDLVAFVLDHGKKVLQFLLREELHRAGASSGLGFEWFPWNRHTSNRITVLSDVGKSRQHNYTENRP
jgi:hypothetical protein